MLLSNNIFIGSRLREHSGWELASTKPREARAHRGKQGQWRLLKVYFSYPWVYLYLENNPEKMWHNVTFYFSVVLGLWAGVDVSLCGAVREQQGAAFSYLSVWCWCERMLGDHPIMAAATLCLLQLEIEIKSRSWACPRPMCQVLGSKNKQS